MEGESSTMKSRTRRFLKCTIGAELRKQLVTSVKLRRGPCDDDGDFKPVVGKAHSIRPIGLGIGDKGYDDEKNHESLREELHAVSVIPARNEDAPACRTGGKYRKEMERGYSRKKCHQRSKVETISSVIKRTVGDEIGSVRAGAQDNETRMKIIRYDAARIVDMASSLLRGFLQSRVFGFCREPTLKIHASPDLSWGRLGLRRAVWTDLCFKGDGRETGLISLGKATFHGM